MPDANSLNTSKGRKFQLLAAEVLSSHFGVEFFLDHPLPIGDPARPHGFDLVSSDLLVIGECKSYSWTESGNVPSAKMGFVNEATFYLSFLPRQTTRFVVLRRDVHPRRVETVADYYFRTYRHLLRGVVILELDAQTGTLREL